MGRTLVGHPSLYKVESDLLRIITMEKKKCGTHSFTISSNEIVCPDIWCHKVQFLKHVMLIILV